MNWLVPAGTLVLGLIAGGYAVSRWQAGKQTMDTILTEARQGDPESQRAALTEETAAAVEAMSVPDCDHRHRPSCAKCSARKAIADAAAKVRETGGVTRQEAPGA